MKIATFKVNGVNGRPPVRDTARPASLLGEAEDTHSRYPEATIATKRRRITILIHAQFIQISRAILQNLEPGTSSPWQTRRSVSAL